MDFLCRFFGNEDVENHEEENEDPDIVHKACTEALREREIREMEREARGILYRRCDEKEAGHVFLFLDHVDKKKLGVPLKNEEIPDWSLGVVVTDDDLNELAGEGTFFEDYDEALERYTELRDSYGLYDKRDMDKYEEEEKRLRRMLSTGSLVPDMRDIYGSPVR